MFEVEKPRQFHYVPRFYDPEKEKWEALKKKYAIEQEKQEKREEQKQQEPQEGAEGEELEYFEQRLRDLDRERRQKASQLTWRDLFRKREMPKFNYTPRFSGEASKPAPDNADGQELVDKYYTPKHKIKIRRRFDIGDIDYMKPIPASKIIIYTGIVCLLLAFIFVF